MARFKVRSLLHVKHIAWFIALSLLPVASGCGAASGDTGSGKLEPSDVRSALQTLPYRFQIKQVKGPAGNTASFAGQAHGPHHTNLEFSIGIGGPPHAVPVPGAGTKHVVWYEEMGFVFNDDSDIDWKFKTAAQWQQVARMAAKVNGSLCRAATGEPCPI